MIQYVDCPYCDGTTTLKSQPKVITYKQELVSVEAYYYQCDKCLEEFTTTESDTSTMAHVHK